MSDKARLLDQKLCAIAGAARIGQHICLKTGDKTVVLEIVQILNHNDEFAAFMRSLGMEDER